MDGVKLPDFPEDPDRLTEAEWAEYKQELAAYRVWHMRSWRRSLFFGFGVLGAWWYVLLTTPYWWLGLFAVAGLAFSSWSQARSINRYLDSDLGMRLEPLPFPMAPRELAAFLGKFDEWNRPPE